MRRVGRFCVNELMYMENPSLLDEVPCDIILERQFPGSGYIIFTGESYQFKEIHDHEAVPTYDLIWDRDFNCYKFKPSTPTEYAELKMVDGSIDANYKPS